MIDRHKFVEELKLRKQIRKAVKIVKENRKKKADQVLLEETQLRKYVRKLLVEADTAKPEESPHQKTGINALEALLHNIIPQIKDEFLQLTTSEEQRTSFRRHMIYNVMGLLKPPTVNDAAPGSPPAVAGAEEKFIAITEQEDIELTVDDQGGDADSSAKYIPGADPDEKERPEEDEDLTAFAIPGEDETGRDYAFDAFDQVSSQILRAYNKLGNEEDREIFYDYLLTNLQLYFDKFENELKVNLPEPPKNPAYEAAKGEEAPA
jgi:hypothetical protein